MTDPVAGQIGVRIGHVLMPGNAVVLQKGLQLFFFPVKDRPEQASVPVHAGHASEAGPACAPQQSEDDVLGQVVGMVSGNDPVRIVSGPDGFQKGIAQIPGGFFQTAATAGLFSYRKMGCLTGQAKTGANGPGML